MGAGRSETAQTPVLLARVKPTDKCTKTLPPVHHRSFTP